MKILASMVAVLMLFTAPAQAMYFCSEPSEPYCVNSYGAFSDGYEFEDCKREVESYGDDVNRYLDCLADKSQAAIDAYNNAVEGFNRRARGY